MIRILSKFTLINSLTVFLFFVIFCLIPVSANSLNVTLVSPKNNEIFNATNNVTFICNTTSDQYLRSVGLYHDLNGSFVLNQTNHFGELESDSSTILLMHFNNDSSVGENDTYVHDWSGNNNNGTVFGATYKSTLGKFFGSFEFNNINQDYVEINHSNKLNLANGGSIGFWVRPTSSSKWRIVLFKGTGVDWASSPFTFRLEDSSNKICMYISNSDGVITNLCSQGGLNLNTWYHVVGTWNSSDANLYVNGLLNGTYAFSPGEFPLLESTYPLTIGKTDTGLTEWYAYFNGSVDELIMYNRVLSLDEIQEHYQRNLVKNTTQNWTINYVSDGSYKWNCFSEAYGSLSDWGDTNYTFHVDMYTPPIVNAIILSPSSADDIDPGIIINITANVTDVSNVSTVIFQWKRKLESVWNNDTMDYNPVTKLYENASINADQEGIYEYRIWSNDTNGYSDISSTQNVTAMKDYTWSVIPTDLGTVSGLINIIDYAGNLTINNTGDGTLYFNLSHSWPLPMYFNGSENSLSFSLDEKNIAFVNITIQFAGQDSESSTSIFVDASHDLYTPSPESSTINLIVNSFTGGPYFLVDIIESPTSVSQSQSVNLTAKLKNIGNETATDTWFNWTLPTGWTNTSGEIKKYIGNLNSGSTSWNNLTVSLNPSTASAGIVTIYINASSAENTTDADSRTIIVSCNSNDGVCGAGCNYGTDSDCPSPSTGGDGRLGPVTYITAERETLLLQTEESFELVRGLNDSFVLNVKNPFNKTFKNVSLSVTGYLSQYIRIERSVIEKIEKNETKSFTVFIEAPKYFTKGEHTLNFTINGASRGKEITENRLVTLIIHEVSREEASKYLDKSNLLVQEMEEAGFTINKASELLSKIIKNFEIKEYEEVKVLYETLKETRDSAFDANQLINEVETGIQDSEDKGLKIPLAKNLLVMSKVAFSRGDFDTALKRVRDSQMILSLETEGKINYVKLALDYWWAILLGISTTSIIGYIVYLRFDIYMIGTKLENLQDEEMSIMSNMTEAKEKTFKKDEMSMAEYHKAMYEYEKRLTEIRKGIARLRTRRAGMRTIKSEIRGLEEELKSINELMKETQRSYFQKGEINRKTYDNRMSQFRERIAEINGNLAMFKVRQKQNGGRSK